MFSDKSIDNASAYHDISKLQNLRTAAKQTDGESKRAATEAVAKQLEGVFLNMMLKSMREANAVFGQDNPLNSKETEFYQNMFDQQVSLSLAQSKGIGLAEMIVKQMSRFDGEVDVSKEPALPLENSASPKKLENNEKPMPHAVSEKGIALPIERYRRNAVPPQVLEERQKIEKQKIEKQKIEKAPSDKIDSNRVASNPSEKIISDKSVLNFDSPEAFIKTIKPYAQAAASALGIDVNAVLAQAALETGWGQHLIKDTEGSPALNLFGIKAQPQWRGGVARVGTLEYRNGIAAKETANFRSYPSLNDAFNDYVNFLKDSPRYQPAINATEAANQWGFNLQKAGYATDPNYGKKIANIITRLERHD